MLLLSLVLSPLLADECGDILDKGIHDELQLDSYDKFRSKFEEKIYYSYDKLIQESSKGGGEGKVALGILSVVGGGGGEDHRLDKLREEFKKDSKAFYSSENFRKLMIKTINPSVITAWSDCVNQKQILSFYTGDPFSEFMVSIKYSPKSASAPNLVTISDANGVNVEIVSNLLSNSKFKEGAELTKFDFLTQKFRRIDKSKPASVIISFSGEGFTNIDLPVFVEPPPALPKFIEEEKLLFSKGTKLDFPLDKKLNDNNLGGNLLLADFKVWFEIRNQTDVFLCYEGRAFEADVRAQPAGDYSRRVGSSAKKVASYPKATSIVFLTKDGQMNERLMWPISPVGTTAMSNKWMVETKASTLRPYMRKPHQSCQAHSSNNNITIGWVYKGDKAQAEFDEIKIKIKKDR